MCKLLSDPYTVSCLELKSKEIRHADARGSYQVCICVQVFDAN